ncbi:MAG: energy-coupling factor transporter transmembrane component T, partial [Lawsonibacter sp.]
WIFTITLEGVFNAFFMVIRIMMLIAGTFLLTYTTSPILLTDGLESLLNPLKRLRVPVHELAMMMSIALRFIPTLIEETDKIMSAQRARGADFESGNLVQRAKALIPLLVPLFISAFRRADELAVAMECRCYHGGEGRTRLRQLKYQAIDYAALLLFLAVTVLVGVLGRLGL